MGYKNKEQQREYQKRWEEKNKPKRRASARLWKKNNPDKVREGHQEYAAKNKDKIRTYKRNRARRLVDELADEHIIRELRKEGIPPKLARQYPALIETEKEYLKFVRLLKTINDVKKRQFSKSRQSSRRIY